MEILSAALQNGSFLHELSGFDEEGNRVPYRLRHFFIAIDLDAFEGLDSFEKTTGEILRQLRASEKVPGCDRIYTAWEKEYLTWQYRKDRGLPINESIAKELIEMREELGLREYIFPFES